MEGSCHCGAIRFEAPVPTRVTQCNCSYCDRAGALWAYCEPAELTLLTPAAAVSTYRFGREVVEHHYCAACGLPTHQHSPDFSSGAPDFDHPKVGYNVRMMRDLDRSTLTVETLDGAQY